MRRSVLFFVLVVNCILTHNQTIAEFSPTTSTLNDDLQSEHQPVVLEVINGRDYRFNVNNEQSGKPWHDKRYITYSVRPGRCERLQNSTCFGSKVPYKFTSLALTDATSQIESRAQLHMFEALRNVPKCWAVIQPYLCAVFIPKCEKLNEREMVYLPSSEMCRVTLEPCRIFFNTSLFKEFLGCHDQYFPCRNCSNDARQMKFNATGQCLSPLVQTESSANHYVDIEGCGIQCKDPLYTNEEHEAVHTYNFWGVIVCAAFSLFVAATFLIHDWKHSKHPAWILFYINICLLFNWIGWILQFLPGNRENIVCRRDGTLRYSEPSAGENLACIIPFILIYYFSIATTVWFVIFTYVWCLQTNDRGTIRDRIDKEVFYYHFIAWGLPFILTVLAMVLNEVDGNSILGICFVGYRNRSIRIALFDVPIAILILFSGFFSSKGVLNLIRIKNATSSSNESKKLSSHILGMGVRTMVIVFLIVAFFAFENYEIRNANTWAGSLRQFIICRIQSSYSYEQHSCKMTDRPSVAVLQLRLMCLFGVSLVISSWCWTWATFRTWNRFLRQKMGYDNAEEAVGTKPKHRIIADAYAKRMDTVVSVSIQNSHTDPAGLNFNPNILDSTESNAMSATLANYMYHMINRRNAVTSMDIRNGLNAAAAPHGNSYESEYSVEVQRYSVSVQESRRGSVDSEVSIKKSETEIRAKVKGRSKNHKNVNMKTRRHDIISGRVNRSRRASNSSVESQRITNHKQIEYHYQNRGNGNTVAARQEYTTFTQLTNGQSLTTSDDDDLSINEIALCE